MYNLKHLWPSQEHLDQCMPIQAEYLSPGTLWAVHEPMELLFIPASRSDLRNRITDHDFLTELLSRTDGPLPVLGSSGSGKSHLIRWIGLELSRLENQEKYHVIRIPKNASLKLVLTSLVEGLGGEVFDDLRERAAGVSENKSALEVAQQLVLFMGQSLVSLHAETTKRIDEFNEPNFEFSPFDELVLEHGDPTQGLATLINDQYFQQAVFISEESPVYQTAYRIVGGGDGSGLSQKEISETRETFKEGELNFTNFEVSSLSLPARNYIRSSQIQTSIERQKEVLELLDRLLDDAHTYFLRNTIGYGGDSFQDLFREIRKHLKGLGKSLVVLVEDMAVIKAISDTLVECLLEDSGENLCRIHSVLASTSEAYSYNKIRSSILTRASGEWVVDIDERDLSLSEIHQRVIGMCGRYLNAARHGKDYLDKLFFEGTEEVPVFEDESGWEQTDAQHSLYPFTKTAIATISNQTLSRNGINLTFRPREVLDTILTTVLTKVGKPWADSDFPRLSPFNGMVTVHPDILSDLKKMNISRVDQVAAFISIWGGNVEHVDQVRKYLTDQTLEEFGFSEIASVEYVPSEDPSEIDEPDQPPVIQRVDKALQSKLAQIEDWVQEKIRLPSGIASDLRTFFSNLQQKRLTDDIFLPDSLMKLPAKSIGIPNSGSDARVGTSTPLFTDTEYKKNKDYVRSVSRSAYRYLKLSEKGGYDRSSDDLVVILGFLDKWLPRILSDRARMAESEMKDKASSLSQLMTFCGEVRAIDSGSDILTNLVQKLDPLDLSANLTDIPYKSTKTLLTKYTGNLEKNIKNARNETLKFGQKGIIPVREIRRSLARGASLAVESLPDEIRTTLIKEVDGQQKRLDAFKLGLQYTEYESRLDLILELISRARAKRLLKNIGTFDVLAFKSEVEGCKNQSSYESYDNFSLLVRSLEKDDFKTGIWASKRVDNKSIESLADLVSKWEVFVNYLESEVVTGGEEVTTVVSKIDRNLVQLRRELAALLNPVEKEEM